MNPTFQIALQWIAEEDENGNQLRARIQVSYSPYPQSEDRSGRSRGNIIVSWTRVEELIRVDLALSDEQQDLAFNKLHDSGFEFPQDILPPADLRGVSANLLRSLGAEVAER
jgi:hypothetical protein